MERLAARRVASGLRAPMSLACSSTARGTFELTGVRANGGGGNPDEAGTASERTGSQSLCLLALPAPHEPTPSVLGNRSAAEGGSPSVVCAPGESGSKLETYVP